MIAVKSQRVEAKFVSVFSRDPRRRRAVNTSSDFPGIIDHRISEDGRLRYLSSDKLRRPKTRLPRNPSAPRVPIHAVRAQKWLSTIIRPGKTSRDVRNGAPSQESVCPVKGTRLEYRLVPILAPSWRYLISCDVEIHGRRHKTVTPTYTGSIHGRSNRATPRSHCKWKMGFFFFFFKNQNWEIIIMIVIIKKFATEKIVKIQVIENGRRRRRPPLDTRRFIGSRSSCFRNFVCRRWKNNK